MLNIIFEDESILVVYKPTGLVVNRAQSVTVRTLQDVVSDYLKSKDLGIGDRAGIVHRLDRETSGLLVIAKTQKCFDFLQEQFKNRKVSKKYVALVHGVINNREGTIDAPIMRIGNFGRFGIDKNGKVAMTEYKVDKVLELKEELFEKITKEANFNKVRTNYLKKQARKYSLVSLFPKTGRTHQLRVHLKSINHPIVSDTIYTPHKLLKFDLLWCARLFLHAKDLEFFHPKTQKRVSFTCPLPDDLKVALEQLEHSI